MADMGAAEGQKLADSCRTVQELLEAKNGTSAFDPLADICLGKASFAANSAKDWTPKPDRHAHRLGVYESAPRQKPLRSFRLLPLARLAKKIARFIILRKPSI